MGMFAQCIWFYKTQLPTGTVIEAPPSDGTQYGTWLDLIVTHSNTASKGVSAVLFPGEGDKAPSINTLVKKIRQCSVHTLAPAVSDNATTTTWCFTQEVMVKLENDRERNKRRRTYTDTNESLQEEEEEEAGI
jgi:hypothetical protein